MKLWADDSGTPAGFWATVATVSMAVIAAAVVVFRLQNNRITALEKERVAFRVEKRKDVVELMGQIAGLQQARIQCEKREADLAARLEILERPLPPPLSTDHV